LIKRKSFDFFINKEEGGQMKKRIYLVLFVLLVFPGYSFSEDRNFELGLGIGSNLDGISTTHGLIAPAVNFKLSDNNSLWLHLEGDIEIISDDKTTFVFGAAPMLRYYLLDNASIKPFVEAGAGPNLISRSKVENRELGGSFIFSVMGGAGIEFKSGMKIAYRFRHLSNAGLYEHNDSINAHCLMLSFGF